MISEKRPRAAVPLAGLLALLVLGAPCCGSPCSTYLGFNAPVPDMRLAPGDTASYELFGNVWTLFTECGGTYSDERFPEAFAASENPAVAIVRLDTTAHAEPSRVHVQARAPGQTTVVVRAQYERDCEHVLDATHFTVTVTP